MKKEFSSQLRKMLLFRSKWPPWRRLLCERHCSSFSTLYIITSCIIQLLREIIGTNGQWYQDTNFRVKSEPPLLWMNQERTKLSLHPLSNEWRIWPSPSPPIIALISGFLKISWIGHIHQWRHSRRSSHLGLDLVSCEVKASGNSPGVFYNFTQNGDNRLFYDVQML